MKNTVNVLAHDISGHERTFRPPYWPEFPRHYRAGQRVTVELEERVWSRMSIPAASPIPTLFQAERARPFTKLVLSAGDSRHESGIRDLIILKSTASGFEVLPDASSPRCRKLPTASSPRRCARRGSGRANRTATVRQLTL